MAASLVALMVVNLVDSSVASRAVKTGDSGEVGMAGMKVGKMAP